MNGDTLRRRLLGSDFVRAVEWFDEVDSTNDALRRLAADGAPEGTVVVAGGQTAGRGRLGRRWHSAPGKGLYISVLLRPTVPLAEVTRWTLGAAVAACEACRAVVGESVVIEWPNDLAADGRKLAGILAELRSSSSRVELVLGTGFNVNHAANDFPTDVIGTSLALLASERSPDRESLAVDYLQRLGRISAALDAGRWEATAQRWVALSPSGSGHPVRVSPGDGSAAFRGITAGLGERGQLRVCREDGRQEEIHMVDAVDYLER